MRRSQIKAALCAAVGTFFLAGASAAFAQTKIAVGTGIDAGFAPMYVADQAGLFKKYGLDTSVKTFPFGAQTLPPMITNDLQIAVAAGLPGMTNFLVDKRVRLVGQLTSYERSFAVVARNKFKTIESLKGAKIGITKGTAGEVFWNEVLRNKQLKAEDFSSGIQNVEPPEMIAALERGNIDALASWDPWIIRTVQAVPETHVITDNAGIFAPKIYVFMMKDWVDGNRDAALNALRAINEAIELIGKRSKEVDAMVGKMTRLSPDLVAGMMPKLSFALKIDKGVMDEAAVNATQLVKAGRIKDASEFEVKTWIDAELLRAVKPSAVSLQ